MKPSQPDTHRWNLDLPPGRRKTKKRNAVAYLRGKQKRGMKSTQRRPKRYVYLGFEYGVYNG